MVDPGREHRRRQRGMRLGAVSPSSRIGPSTAIRRVDVALLAKRLQRRRHRRRIGVVAFVDQQDIAAAGAQPVALAAPLEPAHVGQREAGDGKVGADRLDRGQHGERVRHPMVAALGDGEGQFAVDQPRGDQAAAIVGAHGVDRGDVGLAAAEGHDAPRMAPRGLEQAVALGRVLGDDRDAAGLEPLEDLGLGVGDRLDRAEMLDMRRGDGGDQRDVRAHQPGQRGDLAGMVHAHFEARRIFAVARHAREAERNAGVVVVALDRAVDPARREAVERGEQRFLGRGLADRSGDPDHRAAHPCARRDGERGQRRRRHRRRGRAGRRPAWLTSAAAAPAAKAPATNSMPVGDASRHGHEQVARRRPRGCRRSRRSPRTARCAAAGRGLDFGRGPQRGVTHAHSPRDGDVVERQHAVADDLALLMALAGEQDDVARLRHRRSRRRWPRGGRRSRSRRARPPSTARRIAAGSSLRGLSSVTMTRSLSRAATSPIARALALVAVAAGADAR